MLYSICVDLLTAPLPPPPPRGLAVDQQVNEALETHCQRRNEPG